MATNEAASLSAAVHAKQDKLNPTSVSFANQRTGDLETTAPRQRGVMDEQFPTNGLQAKDPRDKEMMARLKLQQQMPQGVTPFGKLQARPEDFKWLQQKQAAEEAANFQAWFAREFDHMSPADKKRAKELYPEFYSQRKKLLKMQAKNLVNLARIKLEGIQSKEDLITTYLAESGRLNVGPLKHLLNPEQDPDAASAQARFKRGLLSPFRVFGDEAVDINGESNRAERGYQSFAFASRDVPGKTLLAGANETGFPPFTDDNYSQGDVAWYNMLSQP
jgi:hypothetical protein